MTNLKSIFAPIEKSLRWFILTLVIGLSQVWVVFIAEFGEMSLEQFIIDGGILFFSIVLISSLMIDHFLFSEGTLSGFVKFMFSIVPICLILPSVALFISCYMAPQKASSHLEFIGIAQIIIFAITALYAILIKLDYLKNVDSCKTQQKQ
ncbi:MAG: hypothetical protein VSS75_001510 [Candidatus Parabeggiatoa sp.]|nr:hypothetical protein [Candidatus Parabeggiatoa sp.]